jgi:hypothetical protein
MAGMSVSSRPLLIVLGPSGAGKSTLAAALAAREGGLHIELDQWPLDGFTSEELGSEWDDFTLRQQPAALRDECLRRIVAGDYRSGVLSVPGNVVFPVELMALAWRHGLPVIVLFGSSQDCLNAFLLRESATGRRLNADDWMAANAASYARHSRPEYAPYRLEAFRSGAHRAMDELLDEVIAYRGD